MGCLKDGVGIFFLKKSHLEVRGLGSSRRWKLTSRSKGFWCISPCFTVHGWSLLNKMFSRQIFLRSGSLKWYQKVRPLLPWEPCEWKGGTGVNEWMNKTFLVCLQDYKSNDALNVTRLTFFFSKILLIGKTYGSVDPSSTDPCRCNTQTGLL